MLVEKDVRKIVRPLQNLYFFAIILENCVSFFFIKAIDIKLEHGKWFMLL